MKQDDLIEKITKNLNKIVNEKGLNNLAIARLTDISTGAVSKIMNGRTNISVQVLLKLVRGLNVPVNEILQDVLEENFAEKQTLKNEFLYAGVLSIDNQRSVCIKNSTGEIIGISNLDKGLDLAETMPSVLQLIVDVLQLALKGTVYQNISLQQLHVAIVLQSYEFEETRRKFEQYAKRHFQSIKLLPDWQITYRAAFADTPGISVVTDKGVSCSYLVDNHIKKLGGWKFPVYDLGGENWLGLMAIHHTIEAYEGYTPMTELAARVLGKFNGKIEKITETCFKGARDPDIYLLFSAILLRAYLMDEKKASAIVEQGFHLVYKAVLKIDELLGKSLPMIISGSLADIYRKFFPAERLLSSPSKQQEVELLADMARE